MRDTKTIESFLKQKDKRKRKSII